MGHTLRLALRNQFAVAMLAGRCFSQYEVMAIGATNVGTRIRYGTAASYIRNHHVNEMRRYRDDKEGLGECERDQMQEDEQQVTRLVPKRQ